LALLREDAELAQRAEDAIDLELPRDGNALPRRVEISLVDEVERSASQRLARAGRVAVARAATEDTPHALARAHELALEPAVERFVEEALALLVGRHLEHRIDAGLDRALAKEIGAEAVDGADVRLFELRERLVEVAALRRRRLGPRSAASTSA